MRIKLEKEKFVIYIMVGNDSSSKIYVKNKSKACEDVGIEFEETTSQEQLENLIEELNQNEKIFITGTEC